MAHENPGKPVELKQLIDHRLGTYNIFITTDPKLAARFSDYNTFSEFNFDLNAVDDGHLGEANPGLGGAAGKRSVALFNSDSNILEFSHELNFTNPTGKGSKAPKIKLTTWEPGLAIFKKLFFLTLGERLTSLKFQKANLASLGRNLIVSETYDRFMGWLRDRVGLRGGGDHATASSEEEIREYLNKNSKGIRLFVAYGIGDELKYWAGPFSTILGEIEYSNNGKKESMTYHLTPSHIDRMFDEKSSLEDSEVTFQSISIPLLAWDVIKGAYKSGEYGYGRRVERGIKKWSGFTPSIHDCIVKLISNYFKQIGIPNHIIVLPNLDSLLAPTIKQILMEAIGAVPKDITSEMQTSWKSDAKEHIQTEDAVALNLRIFGTVPETITTGPPPDPFAGGYNPFEDPESPHYDPYRAGGSQGPPLTGPKRQDPGAILDPIALLQAQRKLLSVLGLRGNNCERESSNVDPSLYRGYVIEERQEHVLDSETRIKMAEKEREGPSIVDKVATWTGDRLVGVGKVVKPKGLPEPPDDPEAGLGEEYSYHAVRNLVTGEWTDTKDLPQETKIPINDPFLTGPYAIENYADAVMTLELPFQVGEEDAVGVQPNSRDFMTPITRLMELITGKSNDLVHNLTNHWEGNVNVMKVFKEKFGSGTFAGYSAAFSTGDRVPSEMFDSGGLAGTSLDISDDAYFIFGDEDLIRDYLYGEIMHATGHNLESRNIYEQIDRGVPLISKMALPTDVDYFLDPFWNLLQHDIKSGGKFGGINHYDKREFVTNTLRFQGRNDEWKSKHAREKYLTDSFNDSYFEKIQAVVKPTDWTPLGFFNDYDLSKEGFVRSLPDEFSFLVMDENKGALDDLFEMNIPWFIANDKNGNVLSYNFDADNFILNQFFGTIQEIYYNVGFSFSRQAAGAPIDGTPSSRMRIEKIYGVLDKIRRHGGSYGSIFSETGLTDPELNLTQVSHDLGDMILMETAGLSRNVQRNYGSDVITICTLFKDLFDAQYKGVVKTLPMFHHSAFTTVLKPSLVFLKSTPRLNTTSEVDRSTADFFSGMYKIVGFRHKISKKRATSEFTVIKDISSTLSNDN